MPDLSSDQDLRLGLREQRALLDETRTKVTDIRHDLANHEQKVQYQLQLLDQGSEARHNKLAENFGELKNALKWASGLIVSIMLSFMGWAVLQQYNANETTKKDIQTQLNLLKEQDRQRVEYRQEVLARLPPSAAETADAADRRR